MGATSCRILFIQVYIDSIIFLWHHVPMMTKMKDLAMSDIVLFVIVFGPPVALALIAILSMEN